MKKIILTLLSILVYASFAYPLSLIVASSSHAQTSSPSASSVLDELKDKIASRVAQLKLVERRGIVGNVTDVSGTQITLTDVKGDTRFIDVDELTKFIPASSSTTSFGISDIKKDDTSGVLGLYNKQSRRILARAIYQMSLPKMIHGYITKIDLDNYIVSITTDNKDQFDVSVDTTTKSLSYDTISQNLVRSGFSKLKEGEKIFIRGTLDPKNNKSISADLIIIFPDILINIKPVIFPTVVPSTGSGKKLTPIIKY